MITHKILKSMWKLGPGGLKCPCCGPAPAHRAAARRVVRKRLKRFTQHEINTSQYDKV